jgi:hypothetical protein
MLSRSKIETAEYDLTDALIRTTEWCNLNIDRENSGGVISFLISDLPPSHNFKF